MAMCELIEDCGINGAVIAEHFLKVGLKDRHVLFPISGVLPSDIFIVIMDDFLWWTVVLFVRRQMYSHATGRFMLMLWILDQR